MTALAPINPLVSSQIYKVGKLSSNDGFKNLFVFRSFECICSTGIRKLDWKNYLPQRYHIFWFETL